MTDAKLEATLSRIEDNRLRDVAIKLLADNIYFEVQTGSSTHHTYAGGLLEHSLEVVRISCMLADYFEDVMAVDTNLLSRDYLIFGGLLHDIGKLKKHSENGKHIKKGAKIVKKALKRQGEFTKPEIEQIVNIIESHSIVSYKGLTGGFITLEAYLISVADSLSAVLNAGLLNLYRGNTEFALYENAMLHKALIGG